MTPDPWHGDGKQWEHIDRPERLSDWREPDAQGQGHE
jgi:hypothetical protein